MVSLISTRPYPSFEFGIAKVSDGRYWPGMSTAPLISSAFTNAALGFAIGLVGSLARNSRIRATHPATNGVAILVPPRKKYSGSADARQPVFDVGASRDLADRMNVPGATTSGLNRLSLVGPRPLNPTNPPGLSAILSDAIGL